MATLSQQGKREPDVDFTTCLYHAVAAIPCDPRRCSMALALYEALVSLARSNGTPEPSQPPTVAYNTVLMRVTATWYQQDEKGVTRSHRGVIEPYEYSMHLAFLTDVDVAELERVWPENGYQMRLVEHRAPPKNERNVSPEKAAEYKANTIRNRELRLAGLQPERKRKPRAALRRAPAGGTVVKVRATGKAYVTPEKAA